MTLKLEIQNNAIPQENSFSLPKIISVESIPCSDLRRKKKTPPVIPEEFLRRSARIKEIKDRQKKQSSTLQHVPSENTNQSKRSKPRRKKSTKNKKSNGTKTCTVNTCDRRKTTNIQSVTVFWRNVEPSPNLPLVSAPGIESHSDRQPDRVLGLVCKDEKFFVLVKWRHTDAPEYVEKRKCSPEILVLLNEFLNPIPSEERSEPREEARIKTEREEMTYEEFYELQQTVSLTEMQESSGNENYSLHIKLE